MSDGLEFGLQFTTHIARRYRVPDLVELADLARAEGFAQVWLNDNLGHRQVFVVLAAMAQRVPIKLGTACAVPYFRNPLDTADALASLSELTGGRELSAGIARGSTALAGHQLELVRPLSFVAQSVELLQRLLRGERVAAAAYPLLQRYYRFRQTWLELGVLPAGPVRFYCGGNGPRSLEVGGRLMDGVIWGGTYLPLARAGRVAPLLALADRAAEAASPGKWLRKMVEVNVSVDRDAEAARGFVKGYVAHGVITLRKMGLSADEFRAMGVEPGDVERLAGLFAEGASVERAAREGVTEAMVRALVIAGSPEECAEQLVEVCAEARRLGVHQVCLSKLGPDYHEAIRALGRQVASRLA